MGVKEFVDSKISSAPVVVFSKSYCPFCKRTKQLFAQLGVDIVVIEMEDRGDCDEMQDYLKEKTGGRSVSIRASFMVWLRPLSTSQLSQQIYHNRDIMIMCYNMSI